MGRKKVVALVMLEKLAQYPIIHMGMEETQKFVALKRLSAIVEMLLQYDFLGPLLQGESNELMFHLVHEMKLTIFMNIGINCCILVHFSRYYSWYILVGIGAYLYTMVHIVYIGTYWNTWYIWYLLVYICT